MRNAKIKKMAWRFVQDKLTAEDKEFIKKCDDLGFFFLFNYYVQEYSARRHDVKEDNK